MASGRKEKEGRGRCRPIVMPFVAVTNFGVARMADGNGGGEIGRKMTDVLLNEPTGFGRVDSRISFLQVIR